MSPVWFIWNRSHGACTTRHKYGHLGEATGYKEGVAQRFATPTLKPDNIRYIAFTCWTASTALLTDVGHGAWKRRRESDRDRANCTEAEELIAGWRFRAEFTLGSAGDSPFMSTFSQKKKKKSTKGSRHQGASTRDRSFKKKGAQTHK